MSDGPQTMLEAVRHFSGLDVCHRYMLALKWPDGKPVCPKCGGDNIGAIATRRLLKCRPCQKQFSAKTDTIFEDSPLPLSDWFVAVWAAAQGDIGSVELAAALGTTQKTAWLMTHRIKMAMTTHTFREMVGVEYRPVVGWDAYRVGDDGSVWSMWDGKAHTLDTMWTPLSVAVERYRYVTLYDPGGAKRRCKVAHLVLEAFVGPRPDGTECRHLDGDSLNDAKGNLCWGTKVENEADKDRHGTKVRGTRHWKGKLTEAQVAEIRSLRGKESGQSLADRFGVGVHYISRLWGNSEKLREVK